MDNTIRKFMPLVLLSIMAISIKGQAGDTKITRQDIIGKAWKAMFGERHNMGEKVRRKGFTRMSVSTSTPKTGCSISRKN